jgi:predicted permease
MSIQQRLGRSPRSSIMEQVRTDLDHALRTIRRSPGSALLSTSIMAMAVAVTATTMTLITSSLREPFPRSDDARLSLVWTVSRSEPTVRGGISGAVIGVLEEDEEVFTDAAGWWVRYGSIPGERAEQIEIAWVTRGFFEVLGTRPALGTSFTPDDHDGEGRRGIILSDGLWRGRFASDPGVVGSGITLNGIEYEVRGVLPAGFHPPPPVTGGSGVGISAWIPYGRQEQADPDWFMFQGIARVRPGISDGQLAAATSRISAALHDAYPLYRSRGVTVAAATVREDLTARTRPVLLTLAGGTVLFFAVGVVTLLILFLLWSRRRSREIEIRARLGAPRWRMFVPVFIQTLTVLIPGTVLGWVASAYLLRHAPAGLVDLLRVARPAWPGASASIMAASAAVAVSLIASRRAVVRWEGGGDGRAPSLAPAVAQVAIAALLAIGAGMVFRSYQEVRAFDRGIAVQDVVSLRCVLPSGAYATSDPGRTSATYEEIIRRIERLPATGAVGISDVSSLRQAAVYPTPVGRDGELWGSADYTAVSGGYFRAAGITLLAGRTFSAADSLGAPTVVVVDDRLARRLWPDGDAVGRQLTVSRHIRGISVRETAEVIGIVRHVQSTDPRAGTLDQVYMHHLQSPRRIMMVTVRHTGSLSGLEERVTEALVGLPAPAPSITTETLTGLLADETAPTHDLFRSLLALSLAAVLMTLTGVYAAFRLMVDHQRRHIGIRKVLGAPDVSILGRILSRGLGLCGLGVGLASLGAAGAARLLRPAFYGIGLFDLPIHLLAAVTVTLVVLLALLPPALVAMRSDPRQVLRDG